MGLSRDERPFQVFVGTPAVGQCTGHPEVIAEDDAPVQRIIDEGTIFEARRARTSWAFPEIGDAIRKAVIKRHKDGGKTRSRDLAQDESPPA